MQVTLNNSFTVDEPIDRVWDFLSDPRKVAPCMPGAEILEAVSATEYKGAIKMKLGPLSVKFDGEITIEHMDPATHEIRIVGRGKDSKGTGSASMVLKGRLTALPGGGTEMTSESETTINGKMAQFGSRMIQDVSKALYAQFTAAFAERLKADTAGRPAPAAPQDNALSMGQVAGAVVKGAFNRLLGKDKEKA
jgi:hypothetical protein